MKWNEIAGRIAGDIVGFVDDLRLTGFSIENAWAVARHILAQMQYLGIQDAPRKRRLPSQTPGAWAGAIFKIMPEKILVSVSQSKWEKGREMVKELLWGFLYEPLLWLDHKDLERKRGFLGHLGYVPWFFGPLHEGISSYHRLLAAAQARQWMEDGR
jgi:hypothetical protein